MKPVPRRQPYRLLPSCRHVSGKEGALRTSLGNSRSKDNWFLNENTDPTTPRSQEESYCPLSLEHSLRGQAPRRGHWSRGVPQVRADLYLPVHRWVQPSRVCPETRTSACQPRPQRCPKPVRVKAAFIQVAPQSLLSLYSPGSQCPEAHVLSHPSPRIKGTTEGPLPRAQVQIWGSNRARCSRFCCPSGIRTLSGRGPHTHSRSCSHARVAWSWGEILPLGPWLTSHHRKILPSPGWRVSGLFPQPPSQGPGVHHSVHIPNTNTSFPPPKRADSERQNLMSSKLTGSQTLIALWGVSGSSHPRGKEATFRARLYSLTHLHLQYDCGSRTSPLWWWRKTCLWTVRHRCWDEACVFKKRRPTPQRRLAPFSSSTGIFDFWRKI